MNKVALATLLKNPELVEHIDTLMVDTDCYSSHSQEIATKMIPSLELDHKIRGITHNIGTYPTPISLVQTIDSIRYGIFRAGLVAGVSSFSEMPMIYSTDAKRFLVRLLKAKTASSKLQIIKQFKAKAWIPNSGKILSKHFSHRSEIENFENHIIENNISREQQDQFAFRSHLKAQEATAQKKFSNEIIPIWPAPNYNLCVDQDNKIDHLLKSETFAQYTPLSNPKYGTITLGNSTSPADGAACGIIFSQLLADELQLQPLVKILDYSFTTLNPNHFMSIGAALSIQDLLNRNKLSIDQISLFELYEPNAAQVLSSLKSFESKQFNQKFFGINKPLGAIDLQTVNVNGGTLAFGDSLGATSMRMLLNLARELKHRNSQFGVMSLCSNDGVSYSFLMENSDVTDRHSSK